ncbi:uncharacterized protein H6S33_011432 [Morchella sextelata]|uniref:uncharacterized protein n=1 Tax=Morchella sextelata TaxID=1174677 RepID=UPI001D054A5A|nr:uncharacterized protein H6S33_011432 [Morchella sextelata]KAH0611005.1 hypothetical protein H6S33_011432 [Morchella sextelata]
MVRVKSRPGALSEQEREDRIHRALSKRAEYNTPWSVLALEFGIAASTLNDRFNGRKNRREAHQDQQKLPPSVERALKKWCQDMDDAGFPPRVDLLRGMATALAQKIAEEEHLGPDAAHIGRNWITRFLDRHPDLSAKYSTQLDRQRQLANNPITLRDYYNKLNRLIHTLISKGFRPNQDTYNFDEKGFILGYSSKAKVICRSGKRNPNVAQDGSWELITVIEAVSVAGCVLPAWVIYKGKSHYIGWHQSTDDAEAVFCFSDNGWTNNNMGLRWLKEHFDIHSKKISGARPCLLILDGHGSHLTYEFCSYASSQNIHIMCLPAHSTHLLQPLDVGLFGPLQHYYGKAADTHLREIRTGINKSTFWSFFVDARKKTYTKSSIQAAFRTTGIFPFNPDKVLTKLKPNQKPGPATPWKSNLQILHHPCLQTPKNRCDLRHQTQFALNPGIYSKTEQSGSVQVSNINQGPVPGLTQNEYKAIILRMSHLAEESLTQAEIAKIQLRDIRVKYEGKRAVKTDRRVISKAQVITGAEIMRLKALLEKKEADKLKKGKRTSKTKTGKTKSEGQSLVP